METNALISALGSNLPRAQALGQSPRVDKAREVAESFEAVFITQMLKPMFENLGKGPFGGGKGEEVYKTLLIDEYGKAIASRGGIGIADAVFGEIIKLQEAAK
jgi:Rod binding domain-containing protein